MCSVHLYCTILRKIRKSLDESSVNPEVTDVTGANGNSTGQGDGGPSACDPRFSAEHPVAPERSSRHQPHSHTHSHAGTHAAEHGLRVQTATAFHRRRLALVIAVTLTIVGVQVVGSLLSGSLSLLADAAHMLTDAAGVAIALGASYLAALPASAARSFGYLRVEVLAALVNGLILCVVSIVVLVEALRRIGEPADVEPGIMLIAAVIGAIANLVSMLMLRSGQRQNLNVRGAYLEVLGDLLGSVAVIVAALVIWGTGWVWADQVASIVIAVLILPRAFSLLREVVEVLLEATPRGIDTEQIRTHLCAIPGVVEVHDLHAWTITSGVLALSAHVTVADDAWSERGVHEVLDESKACLREHFGVDHSTLQLEPGGHRRAGPHRHR